MFRWLQQHFLSLCHETWNLKLPFDNYFFTERCIRVFVYKHFYFKTSSTHLASRHRVRHLLSNLATLNDPLYKGHLKLSKALNVSWKSERCISNLPNYIELRFTAVRLGRKIFVVGIFRVQTEMSSSSKIRIERMKNEIVEMTRLRSIREWTFITLRTILMENTINISVASCETLTI